MARSNLLVSLLSAPPRWPAFLPPTPGQFTRELAEQKRALLLAQSRPPPVPAPRDLTPRINVSLSDRWYVLGMTQSGKTTFVKRLVKELRALYPHARLYVCDSKGADDFARWPGLTTSAAPPRPLRTPGAVQVWQPPDDDPASYEGWLEGILKARQHAIVLIDELSSLSKSMNRPDYPSALAKLLKQGAKLGICTLCLSQEAAYLPRQLKTQASHLVRFRLQEDDHAAGQAARLLGLPESREPRKQYGFWYRNLRTMAPPFEYGSLSEFF